MQRWEFRFKKSKSLPGVRALPAIYGSYTPIGLLPYLSALENALVFEGALHISMFTFYFTYSYAIVIYRQIHAFLQRIRIISYS